MKNRLTRAIGEYTRGFASEDGLNYRTERQEMDPVLRHIKFLDDKVNQAPTVGNQNDWHYAGSIPMVVLTDWVNKNGFSMHDFAVNNNNCKTRFMAYLKSEMPAFLTKRTPKTFAVT